MSPEFFGDKRGEWMQQSQSCVEYACQGFNSLRSSFFLLQLSLGYFHIPVCKIRPEEFINLSASFAILKCLEESFYISHKLLQPCPDPVIGQSPVLSIVHPPSSIVRKRSN